MTAYERVSIYATLHYIILFAFSIFVLTLVLRNPDISAFANSVDPDQLANQSGSALLVIKYVNLYQQPVESNLIGWKLEVGVFSIYSGW